MHDEELVIKIPDEVEAIALCGGPYNNFSAVEAFLDETKGTAWRFCLGDLGGFGPYPDLTIDLIRKANIICLQGNYDEAVSNSGEECGCGYLDPLDRKFAQISFDYTFTATSEHHKTWMRSLPKHIFLNWRRKKILLCHGSPDQVNEFVFESETKDKKIENWLDTNNVDAIFATHSGLPWVRKVDNGYWVNVGVLGRPAHEGRSQVYYCMLHHTMQDNNLRPELKRLNYDPLPVIKGMEDVGLPKEFSEALLKGEWTTCYNILPKAELPVRDRSSGT
ncbi:MAG: metallophosphoesterase family protein [Oligoflexales bacterium]|nr:metallophosphoesterase family protein [Oligoflexales bacterium]